jgi:AAA domain
LPVSWLWAGRIPLGVLSLLAGRPKLGKSTLAYELAAQLTTGELEGDLAATPGNVLVVTFEDLIAETVVPRLCAAGADLSRGRTIEALEGDQRDLVSLPGDVPRIAEAAAEFDVRLLIVDPLMAALAGGTDSHRDSQVRRVLAPLAKLAEERGLAVLTIMHLNKGQGADLIGRIGGSVAFTGAARSLLVFGADPQDPDGEDGCMRVLAQRGNLAPRAPSLSFRIEGRVIDGPDGQIPTSRLVCLGESEARADELLASVSTAEERTERDEAIEFLRAELEDGPRNARDVKTAARDAGISDATLRRAKAQLGISSGRVGGAADAGHWEWSLRCSPLREHLSQEQGEHLRENPIAQRDRGISESLRRSLNLTEHVRGEMPPKVVPPCSCFRPGSRLSDGRCLRCYGRDPEGWAP